MESEDRPEVDEIDRLRAAEWGLLAVLMGRAPSADLLDRVARLTGDATELGMAHIALGEAAAATDETRAVIGHYGEAPHALLLFERNGLVYATAGRQRFALQRVAPWTYAAVGARTEFIAGSVQE